MDVQVPTAPFRATGEFDLLGFLLIGLRWLEPTDHGVRFVRDVLVALFELRPSPVREPWGLGTCRPPGASMPLWLT